MVLMFTLYNFYRSDEWEGLRKIILLDRINNEGELICEHCGKPITKAYDAICHHVKELTESNVNDYNVSLNPENIVVVHHRCHNEIHNRFGRWTRHIYIVWGSPCAGKTTYVDENCLRDDIIVDIDRIYSAITNDRSGRLYGNVMQVYRSLVDMVKTRNGKWVNAWIVRTLPLSVDRERLSAEVGGELIHIDTDRETCLARAEVRGGESVRLVEEFWKRYTPPRG